MSTLVGHPPPPSASLPKMYAVKQTFPRPVVHDIKQKVFDELAAAIPAERIAGKRIAVTAGSRGISNIAEITRAACDALKSRGGLPFIIPAMGSHGGGTAAGQRKLIEHYGITEVAMAVPIEDSVETVSIGMTPEGVEAFFSKAAWEADGVLLLNRVKPHTDYKGEIESGLTKICAIGLGKLDGAREFHGHLFRLGLGGSIRSATGKILSTGKIIGGLAIVENAYHETASLTGVRSENLFEHEKELLLDAKRLMGSLPFREIDVLYCEEMGKNMSGTGLDTNIVGRSIYGYQPGTAWCDDMPAIWRIVVDRLSPESEGNATGMGLADFVTAKLQSSVNYRITTLNAMTGRAPAAARTPIVLANSRDALLAAVATSPVRAAGPIVVYIRDTLSLETLYISEAALPAVSAPDRVTVIGEAAPLVFDSHGEICSPFFAERAHV